MSLSVEVTIESWWATLAHDRRETVMGSIYEDDMAVGRVFAEMRQLGLIHPGEARRTADATGLRRICWPKHLAADILRLDAAEVPE
jgi:hypothetical protein